MIEVTHLEMCLNKGLKPFVISNRIKQLFAAFPKEFSKFPNIIKLIK
jgi:hypothetical protein